MSAMLGELGGESMSGIALESRDFTNVTRHSAKEERTDVYRCDVEVMRQHAVVGARYNARKC